MELTCSLTSLSRAREVGGEADPPNLQHDPPSSTTSSANPFFQAQTCITRPSAAEEEVQEVLVSRSC